MNASRYCNICCSPHALTDFFEECIKEEQYESQKLELLRDAIRAKPTYTSACQEMSGSVEVPLGPGPDKSTAAVNGVLSQEVTST